MIDVEISIKIQMMGLANKFPVTNELALTDSS